MQGVEAPQERHRVLTAMHGIAQQIEQQKSRHTARPLIAHYPGGESDAKCSLELRPKRVRRRKREGGEDDIEEPDPEIAEAPPPRRKLPLPPRSAEFPPRYQEQTAEYNGEAQQTRASPRR